ncbi:hypothetical protein ACRALDRAFT_1059145 [Sodiomyces alcalophilus JCM 7366]|uniref:uncharacterized protein n=1 Tax=Sodiomyces alcalophilus JCM 7366 TaxID=591952 RepID=UPI0039B3EF11
MSAPSPVPSKAAIRTLRGLLFGTSCSIVILAEERRRRIGIARSAVENGRKLKSLRRYSSAGAAALETLREETATDTTFGNWSLSTSSCHPDPKSEALDYNQPSWDGNDVLDLGPNPRQSRLSTSRRDAGSIPTRRPPYEHDAELEPPNPQIPNSPHRHASRSSSQTTVRSTAVAHPLPKTQAPVDTSQDGTRDPPISIKAALNEFWASNGDKLPSDSPLHQFEMHPNVMQPDRSAPSAALQLLRRAYDNVLHAQNVPAWYLELSRLLCLACQHEGDYDVAGRILEMLVSRGPLRLEDYYAHRPFKIMRSLMFRPVRGVDDPKDHIDLVARLFLADIPDDRASRAAYAALARKVTTKYVLLGHFEAASDFFERAQSVCNFKPETVNWFIGHLQRSGHHVEAIDAFVRSSSSPDITNRPGLECDGMLHSLVSTNGYRALEVFRTMYRLRGNRPFRANSAVVIQIMRQCWESSKHYPRTNRLFEEMESNGFYGFQDTYDIHSVMIRIDLEAGKMMTARSRLEQLFVQYPRAQTDVELRCAFSLPHVAQGNWSGVRAVFDSARSMAPLDSIQQRQYDEAFSRVLRVFMKTHTWGETEDFVEDFIGNLGVTLDRSLVRSIADRHGRCREPRALGQWLKFCKNAGFVPDASFWEDFLRTCRRQWGYGDAQIISLYKELKAFDIEVDFPEVESLVRKLVGRNYKAPRLFRVRMASKQRPSDEPAAFGRMQMEAQKGQWRSVLSSYRRAVHNGMGYSARCLRLAVKASIQLGEGSSDTAMSMIQKAQIEGHDVSGAVVPLILADLERVETEEKEAAAVAGDARGRPYPAILRIFRDLQRDGLRIEDGVFHKAAQVCLALRNYREAISICVFAAEQNGFRDLCYNVYNFSNLCQAFTVRHDYERLRWMLDQLGKQEYRTWKRCRRSLKWMVHYLTKASQAEKAEDLKASDLSMLECVQDALARVSEEKASWAIGRDQLLRGGSHPARDDDVFYGSAKISTTMAA